MYLYICIYIYIVPTLEPLFVLAPSFRAITYMKVPTSGLEAYE